MTTIRPEVIGRLTAAAVRVAASLGLEIFDVQVRREPAGWVVRVVIDRPPLEPDGRSRAEESVGIADCQRVSQDLGTLLDVEEELTEGLQGHYTLEVSSPGLDRPLRGELDFRRFEGRLAKIVTREPIGGQSHFAGRLAGLDDGAVLLAEGRRTHRVPLTLISRARLDVEF